jgi:hypothetical protein
VYPSGLAPKCVTLRRVVDLLLTAIHVARTACGQRDSSLFPRLKDAQPSEPQRQEQQEPRPQGRFVSDQDESQEPRGYRRHDAQRPAFPNLARANVC